MSKIKLIKKILNQEILKVALKDRMSSLRKKEKTKHTFLHKLKHLEISNQLETFGKLL